MGFGYDLLDKGPMKDGYYALDERTAIDYVRTCPPAQALLAPDEPLICEEIGDGNLNLIFRVISARDRARSVIVKQALPYVRLVGESWPLSLDRARIESDALALHAQLCPGLVPRLYHYDSALYLTVMEDLRDAIIMRKGLIAGQRYPNFAGQIAEFLAQTLFKTSDLYLDSAAKKQAVIQFANPELCKLTEDVIFTEPYLADAPNNRHNPLIDPALIGALRANQPLLREVRWLKWAFMTRAEALIHGDLHTGSIMVTPGRAWVIDPEFAYYGPMGFDVGAVLGNLVISYAAQLAHSRDDRSRAEYQAYLLETVADVWERFAARFGELWREHGPAESAEFRQPFLAELLRDSIGFAACKMIRRVLGVAHVIDLELIDDQRLRARAESWVLAIAERLLLQRGTISDAHGLIAAIRACPPPA
jgi:5-methylthioribose kinase